MSEQLYKALVAAVMATKLPAWDKVTFLQLLTKAKDAPNK